MGPGPALGPGRFVKCQQQHVGGKKAAWHRALYTETKDSGCQTQLPLGVAPSEFSLSLGLISFRFSGQFLIVDDREAVPSSYE